MRTSQAYNPFEVLESRLDTILSLLTDRSPAVDIKAVADPTPEEYIDKERVSEILKVSHVTIWEWEKKGILQSYRIGNLKRFKLSEVLTAPKPIKRASKK